MTTLEKHTSFFIFTLILLVATIGLSAYMQHLSLVDIEQYRSFWNTATYIGLAVNFLMILQLFITACKIERAR